MRFRNSVLVFAMVAMSAAAAPGITISSQVLQSNFNGATGAGQTAAIGANPFDFSAQPQLLDIQSISITLTIIDGDTGLGPNGIVDTPYPPDGSAHGDDDFDVNSLSLQLDGVDLAASLLLNGFNNYDSSMALTAGDFVTLTITGTPTAAQASAILTALQDGQLSAFVLDSTGIANSNGFQIPNTLIDRTTPLFATLSLTGTAIPEPSSMALMLVAAAVLLLRVFAPQSATTTLFRRYFPRP